MPRVCRALFALIIVTLTGCPGEGSGDDGPIDARIIDGIGIDGDGDAQPRVCEASPPTPNQATTGGSVLGAWNLTWSCTSGCIGNRPGLTYTRHVDIAADGLAFSSPTCVKCLLTHAATPSLPGCVDVAAGSDWDVQCRNSYRLCERSATIEATITWKEPGLANQVWRLVGAR